MALLDVAVIMATVAVPDKPLEQDIWFRESAISEGIEGGKFAFELLGLELFTFGQIINREKLEGRIDTDICHRLAEEFIQAAFWRIQQVESTEIVVTGLDFDVIATMLMRRNEQYIELLLGEHASFEKIPELFAKLCGLPDSLSIQWIARTVLLHRGNAIGDFLKTVKIVA